MVAWHHDILSDSGDTVSYVKRLGRPWRKKHPRQGPNHRNPSPIRLQWPSLAARQDLNHDQSDSSQDHRMFMCYLDTPANPCLPLDLL